MRRKIVALAAALALLFFSVYSLPFLYDRIHTYTISIKPGSVIVVVSDLHIENNPRNLSAIGALVKSTNASLLVINGDLFDDQYGRALDPNLLVDAFKRMNLSTTQHVQVIYVLALYSHDPFIDSPTATLNASSFQVLAVKGALLLEAPSERIILLHGDYAIRFGFIAGVLDMASHGLALGRMARMVLHVEPDCWVAVGHSHIPGISYEDRVANTGTWLNRFIDSSDTALVVKVDELGKLHLKLVSMKEA
ncbi:MAG: metallophosphoesterase [Candidatus Verstraetearchaeota archaeon]|nr:metallophosphoesterase [Candidatus Verstraetearchaeota archaeon]